MSMSAVQRARRNVRDRAKSLMADEIMAEARRIEADERRAADREARDARLRAERDAEAMVRSSDEATKVVVEYDGIRITAHPERSSDGLRRQQTTYALSEAMHLLREAFEQRVGQARAAAIGKPAPGAWSADHLAARIRDVCRHGIASGAVEVELL